MTKKDLFDVKLRVFTALGLLACSTNLLAADRGAPSSRIAVVSDTYDEITVKDP